MTNYQLASEEFNALICQCYGHNVEIEWGTNSDRRSLKKIWKSGIDHETGEQIRAVFFDSDWQDSPMLNFIRPLLDYIGIQDNQLAAFYCNSELHQKGFIKNGQVDIVTH